MPDQAGDEDVDQARTHELKNLRIAEVSLVDKPANLRPFLMLKSESGLGGRPMPETLTDEQAAQIEAALNAPHPEEAAVLKSIETDAGAPLDDSARNKLTAALRLLGGIADGARKGLAKALAGPEVKPVVEPVVEPPTPPEKETPVVDTTKAETKTPLPAEVVELAKAGDYESIVKAAGDQPGVVALMVELLKSRDSEIGTLKTSVEAILAKADDTAVADLVRDAGLPGMSTEDQVKLVKSFTPEQRVAWSNHAKALRANIAMGETEHGTSRRGEDTYNPLDELNKRTTEMVVKSAGTVNEADAMMKVLEADPKLRGDYRKYVRGEVV